MAILLIGSTGNGKSCLGNFIIDPQDSHLWKHPTFKVAHSNLPETQHVQEGTAIVKFPQTAEQPGDFMFKVIDTPGLNENSDADLRHMISLIENLNKVDLVSACILVVKFESKIDAQYVSTVRYYSKLLPSLFEKNVIVVMTEFATDERSVILRERRGIDVEVVKKNALKAIVDSGCLTYEPMLFTIDSLPVTEDEYRLNLEERNSILQYIQSLTQVSAKTLRFAKTDAMKRLDREVVGKLEGEISGYNERLQQTQEKHSDVLKRIQKKEKLVTNISSELNACSEDLALKEIPDLVVGNTWSLSKPWKMLRTLEERFSIKSAHKIANVSKWTNGKCEWNEVEETMEVGYYVVKGKVTGQFMRGLYASITLEIKMEDKYADSIRDLKKRIEILQDRKTEVENDIDHISADNKECKKEIKLLRHYISEKRRHIEENSSDWMTLEEAQKRLII